MKGIFGKKKLIIHVLEGTFTHNWALYIGPNERTETIMGRQPTKVYLF